MDSLSEEERTLLHKLNKKSNRNVQTVRAAKRQKLDDTSSEEERENSNTMDTWEEEREILKKQNLKSYTNNVTARETNLKEIVDSEDEAKKEARRAANRRSAFKSRQRCKILVEDLQKDQKNLSTTNNELRKMNSELRAQLEVLRHENQLLRYYKSNSSMGCTVPSSSQYVASESVVSSGGQPLILTRTGKKSSNNHEGNDLVIAQREDAPSASRDDTLLAQSLASVTTGLSNDSLVALGSLNQLISQKSSNQANSQAPPTQTHVNNSPSLNMQLSQQPMAMLSSDNNSSHVQETIHPSNDQIQLQLAILQLLVASQDNRSNSQTSNPNPPA